MRYRAPDRIRGLALMGILVVNVGFMIGPIGLVLEPPRPEDSLFDQVGWWLLRVGFENELSLTRD